MNAEQITIIIGFSLFACFLITCLIDDIIQDRKTK